MGDGEIEMRQSAPIKAVPPEVTAPVEDVEVAGLHFDLSPREQAPDQGHILTLAELLPLLPPILVHAPTMQVIDGVHRVHAARLRGVRVVKAVLFHGSEAEAFVYAVQANIAHGKPLTLREREIAATNVLRSHPAWSDRRIAGVCGLSPTTVGRIRRADDEDGTGSQAARVGRDGRARPVDPVALRRRIADVLEHFPSASNRQIAARAGASEGTVRDVRARLRDGRSIARALEPAPESDPEHLPETVKGDAAYTADESRRQFGDWFASRFVKDDDEWEPFVTEVPISRVYELADAARRCAERWQRFASALESRAKR